MQGFAGASWRGAWLVFLLLSYSLERTATSRAYLCSDMGFCATHTHFLGNVIYGSVSVCIRIIIYTFEYL